MFVDRGWWDLVLGEPGRVVLTELGVTGLLGGATSTGVKEK